MPEEASAEVEQPQALQDEVNPAGEQETEVDNVPDETNVDSQEETTTEAPEIEATPEEPDWQPEPIEPPKLVTPQTPRPRITQFMNQNGEIDVAAYDAAVDQYEAAREAAMNQTLQEVVSKADKVAELKNTYQREWSKAEDKYPELKSNKQLKEMVQAIHANSAQPGFNYLSPLKAADQLFALRGEAKTQGMKAAQQTRTVQAAAALGSTNPPAPAETGDRLKQLRQQMQTGSRSQRQAATTDYIAEMLNAGKI